MSPLAWARFLRRFLRGFLGVLLSVAVLWPFWSLRIHSLDTALSSSSPSIETLVSHQDWKISKKTLDSTSANYSIVDPAADSTSAVGCWSEKCVKAKAEQIARVFPGKEDRTTWVVTSDSGYRVPANKTCAGIIYVKNFKAASSTAAGIALRLAYEQHPANHNVSSSPSTKSIASKRPHAWVKFAHARGHKYAGRDEERSLLFTSVREPASRGLSRIFYTCVTQKGESTNDQHILDRLRWTHRQYGAVSHEGGGYQVRYLSPHKDLATSWTSDAPATVQDPDQVERYVQEIIDSYDFIMVAERMEESVVVMALLLGLEMGDVLVMNAKQTRKSTPTSNTTSPPVYLYFSQHHPKRGKLEFCKASIPAFRSKAIQAHFESPEWLAKNYGDRLLHTAAQLSLDRTIEFLGGGGGGGSGRTSLDRVPAPSTTSTRYL